MTAAVEGLVDEAAARRVIAHAGGQAGNVYGKSGKPRLRQSVDGYIRAARREPWLVLVDLDGEADCAPELRNSWMPRPARHLCFRVAVRSVEAWLLGDGERLAEYLRVRRALVPKDPESIPDAKEAMVNLVRHSRRPALQKDVVPREGSGRRVGPAYSSRMVEFAEERWRPAVAAERVDSLQRAITCLERLVREASS